VRLQSEWNHEEGMMKDCSECDEALEQRAHKYVDRLMEFAPLDDVEAKLFKRDLLSYVQDYATEHRLFAGLSDHGLKLMWLTAVAFVRADDASLNAELDDATAELLLRGVEPPYGEVRRIAPNSCNQLH
jgi:hypothetical protein